MKWFRKLYVWAMNVKLFMALYFIVMSFAVAAITLLMGGDSLRLLTLLEMLLTSAAVACLQAWLLSDSADYSRGVFFGRSVLWLGLSVLLTTGVALALGWFSGFPGWSVGAFAAFVLLALVLTLAGLKFEQDADTQRLNDDLGRFKARR